MTLPSGFKSFVNNTTLTANEINGYLQQGVLIFDTPAARDSALSGALREGMTAYTKDDNVVRVYDGSGWLATNNAIVSTTKSGAYTDTDRFAFWRFLSTGSFTVVRGGFFDVLCVGGGGGSNPGSPNPTGGGGAGGVVESDNVYLAPGTYTITVGSGGAPVGGSVGSGNGSASSVGLGFIVAPGGGSGNDGPYHSRGFPGGSGGGGGSLGATTGGSSTSTIGNNGGNGRASATKAGGGGGGAGGGGGNSSSGVGGNGGAGVSVNYDGISRALGGGGGGGVLSGGVAGSASSGGGAGGAGAGGFNGAANTGGGAGGNASLDHRAGGSGIVIIRMRYL